MPVPHIGGDDPRRETFQSFGWLFLGFHGIQRYTIFCNILLINDLKEHLADVSSKIYYVRRNTKEMSKLLEKAQLISSEKRAKVYYENLKPLMEHIRKHVDDLEKVVSDEHWDLPKYREMLFIK